MKSLRLHAIGLHALYRELPDGALPKEFILIHKGVNESENGDYVFDDIAAESVMEKYKSRATECMFDWHHASLDEHPYDPALSIKASGWFVPEVRDGNLWATNCRWSDEALRMAAAKEIRYFSPAFDADKSGRVIDIINCALTNMPATHGNESLIAAARRTTSETEEAAMAAEEESKKFEEEARKAKAKAEEEAKRHEETKGKLEEETKARKAAEAAYKKLEESTKKLEKRMKRLEEERRPDDDDDDDDEEDESEEEKRARHARADEEETKRREARGEEEETEEEKKARHARSDEEEEEKRHGGRKVHSRSALNDEIVRLTADLARARRGTVTRDITERVAMAIKRGIIIKPQKAWALSNPKAFAKLEREFKGDHGYYHDQEQPRVTTQTRTLTGEEKAMCRRMQIDEGEYLKSIQERPLGSKLVEPNPAAPDVPLGVAGK